MTKRTEPSGSNSDETSSSKPDEELLVPMKLFEGKKVIVGVITAFFGLVGVLISQWTSVVAILTEAKIIGGIHLAVIELSENGVTLALKNKTAGEFVVQQAICVVRFADEADLIDQLAGSASPNRKNESNEIFALSLVGKKNVTVAPAEHQLLQYTVRAAASIKWYESFNQYCSVIGTDWLGESHGVATATDDLFIVSENTPFMLFKCEQSQTRNC